jgi:hypothetical protein
MNARLSLVAGLIALAAWLAALVLAPKAALLGWLVAFLVFAPVPIGCLSVLMMLVLVPGSWRRLYTRPMLLGSALLPVAALAVVPLLVGVGALYPWADPAIAASYAPFKAAWLSPGFFVVRQVAWFAILFGLWAGLILLPVARAGIAAGGLIAWALVASWMGVDLAESLTPAFHSSIYGLLILGGEWMAAIGFGIAVGLGTTSKPPGLAAAGALMVALLMWAYLHAMQFVVIWSGDIPDEVVWYLARGSGVWAFVSAILFLGQGFGPFFAMLSPSVRSSRSAMIAIGLVTLAMRGVETAWLLLPAQAEAGSAVLFALVAVVAMAGLGAAYLQALARRAPDWLDGHRFAPVPA